MIFLSFLCKPLTTIPYWVIVQEVNSSEQDKASCPAVGFFFMPFFRQEKNITHSLLYRACIQADHRAVFQAFCKRLLCSPTIQACPHGAFEALIGSAAYHSWYGMLSSPCLSELEAHLFYIPFPFDHPTIYYFNHCSIEYERIQVYIFNKAS